MARKKQFCPTCEIKARKWYQEKFWIFLFITLAVLIVSYFIEFLNPFFDVLINYISIIWWAVLLGLLIGGLIERFVPREYIAKYLSAPKKKTIINAAILGFLMSACSHGILAIAIQLYKKGAAIPSVVAFLLAAPWANIVITILLLSFFGLKALFIIAAAILIAIITGLIYQLLEKKGWIEKSPKVVIKDISIWEDIKKRKKSYKFNAKKDIGGVLKGMWALNKMVTWWILIGILAASFAGAFIPTDIFHQYLGPSIIGLVITLVIATIIEVCSEGSSPIAFEIYRQTKAFGNSFVFLMAGVATDYTEIGLLWSNIGRRTAIWLPVITVPQVVALGFLFNIIF
jgi:uncharacterized membrane protein YraQ (UPF0718 family)